MTIKIHGHVAEKHFFQIFLHYNHPRLNEVVVMTKMILTAQRSNCIPMVKGKNIHNREFLNTKHTL